MGAQEPVSLREYVDAQDKALRQHIDDMSASSLREIKAFREENALQALHTQSDVTELRGVVAELGRDVRKLLRDEALEEGEHAAIAKRRESEAHRWSRAGIAVGVAGGMAALVKILLGQ